MRRTLLSILLGTLCATANATGWIEPDDPALRHDIQLLSDYNLLKIPTSSWPLRWSNVQQALSPLPDDADPIIEGAYRRLQHKINAYRQRQGRVSSAVTTTVGKNRPFLQGFGPAQRSESSTEIAIAADNDTVEGRLAYTASTVNAPSFHAFDHSYLNGNLGNWNVGVDMLDRWWGPGWDGSLILSNNPHPIPTLSFQRNRTSPFDSKWLSWLGPWDLNVRFGQFEEERTIPRGQFFAARLVFMPTGSLELGLSRAAQWGGEDRQNDLGTFFNMLVGRDNRNDNIEPENEPGNQLGGYDLRWSMAPLHLALYGQIIGEDESAMLPTAKMQLYGFEQWGEIQAQSYRLFFEYADTATYRGLGFTDDIGYNVAYNHSIFHSGYRYYDESLGHSADNDSVIRTLGLVTANTRGWSTQLIYRNGDINRDDAGLNALSNKEKTVLHEMSLRVDKRINDLQGHLQFGNSRRETGMGVTQENIIEVGIKINL